MFKNKKILFVHIPKTAGTSLIRNLHLNKLKPDGFYSNHSPYGMHLDHGWKESEISYCTLLRNPNERLVSHLRYAISNKVVACRMKNIVNKYKKDNVKMLKCLLDHEINCNTQVKQISGGEDKKDIATKVENLAKADNVFYHPSICYSLRHYSDNEMENMLNMACDNLDKKFDFFGLKENFNKDCARFAQTYGLRVPGRIKKIKSVGKKSKRMIQIDLKDKKVKKLFDRMNKYDLMLYEFAIDRLKKQGYL